MEPLEALAALAPIATDVTTLLVHLAAPKLHAKLPGALPKDASSAGVVALFRRFGEAASAFDKNEGMLEGADRFVRAARTLAKVAGHTSGWDPRTDAPPDAIVDLARVALKHLRVAEPDEGWDRFEGPKPAA
ncbi:MAG TPA: hypothetical protein VGM56_27305 [Byssovorax sp.]|jgi:hypothetical protein